MNKTDAKTNANHGSWSDGGPMVVRGWSEDGPTKNGLLAERRRSARG